LAYSTETFEIAVPNEKSELAVSLPAPSITRSLRLCNYERAASETRRVAPHAIARKLICKPRVPGGEADLISVQSDALSSQRIREQPMMELSMDSFYRGLLASLLTAGFAFSAPAQDRHPSPPIPHAASPAEAPTLTGKERLGRKWTDEQRIDNCNVPIDKRGTKSRPSTCARASTGS